MIDPSSLAAARADLATILAWVNRYEPQVMGMIANARREAQENLLAWQVGFHDAQPTADDLRATPLYPALALGNWAIARRQIDEAEYKLTAIQSAVLGKTPVAWSTAVPDEAAVISVRSQLLALEARAQAVLDAGEWTGGVPNGNIWNLNLEAVREESTGAFIDTGRQVAQGARQAAQDAGLIDPAGNPTGITLTGAAVIVALAVIGLIVLKS